MIVTVCSDVVFTADASDGVMSAAGRTSTGRESNGRSVTTRASRANVLSSMLSIPPPRTCSSAAAYVLGARGDPESLRSSDAEPALYGIPSVLEGCSAEEIAVIGNFRGMAAFCQVEP